MSYFFAIGPTETIPLHEDEFGTIRVAGTRITLELVAKAFHQGGTPEQIADQYPSLALPDVYAVVTWMLRHPGELAEYLVRRQGESHETRARVEEVCPPGGLRARLLARAAGESRP